MTAADESGPPLTVLKDVGLGIPGGENQCARRRIADRCRIRQQRFQALVRCERLALFDTYCGQQAEKLRIDVVDRFFLDDRVDFLEVTVVVGVDRIERLAGQVDERLLGGITGIGQPVYARVRLYAIDTGPGVPVNEEAAPDQPVAVGAGFEREVPVRDLTS